LPLSARPRPKPSRLKSKTATPGKRLKSERTRARIIRACEELIARNGVQGLGVNALAKQTGLGKPLIYRYFGDLDGVIAAWAQQIELWSDDEVVDAKKNAASGEEKVQSLRRLLIDSATRLRGKPALLQVLAHTMSGRSPFAGATAALKKSLGSHHGELYQNDDIFGDPDMIALVLVLYAATLYLAHRAVGDPEFNGIHLDTDEGWTQVMDMVGTVFDTFILAMRLKRLVRTPG